MVSVRRELLLPVLTLLACRTSGEEPHRPAAKTRPNIVFFYADDHARAAVGAYGSPNALTPNLDRLADEGLLFENAFCTNSICAPARAVVLTGRHSHLNGVRTNADTLDPASTTFPQLLQGAGYQTALIGKWHLKADPSGFDHWEVLPGQGSYYNPDFLTANGRQRREGHSTDLVADLALDWLAEERDDSKPFLLMCQFKAPHRTWMPSPAELALFEDRDLVEPPTLFDDWAGKSSASADQEMTIARHLYDAYDLKLPIDPEAELRGPDRWAASRLDRMTPDQRALWDAAYGPRNEAFLAAGLEGEELVRWKFQRYLKNYLRCIAGIDRNVGRVLAALEDAGLAEDTLVVYTSDQGFYLGEFGWYDKRFMYEPSFGLPLIARWPGVTPPGTRDTHLVQNLDFAPTFLELAGAAVPSELQGVSLLPLLAGEDPDDWRTSVYYEYFESGEHAVAKHYGVRTERYKLIHFHELGDWELYDLELDPLEVANRAHAAEYAGIAEDLREELERLRELYEAP